MRVTSRLIRAGLLSIAMVVACAVAAWADDHAQIRFSKSGMNAARAVQVKRSDLPPTLGWTGHVEQAGTSSGPKCTQLHPRRSDLIVIGDAGVQWAHPGVQIWSGAQVLKTPQMVALDWQRQLGKPQFIECMRESAQNSSDPSWHFVSLTRLPFPQVGTHTAAFRALYDLDTAVERLMVDVIFVARGRTEITLTTIAPISAAEPIRLVQTRMARRLNNRVRE